MYDLYAVSLVPRPLPSFPLLAFYRTASDGKLDGGLGTRLVCCNLVMKLLKYYVYCKNKVIVLVKYLVTTIT